MSWQNTKEASCKLNTLISGMKSIWSTLYSPYQIMNKATKPMNSTAEKTLRNMLKTFMREGNWTEQACLAVEDLTGLERHSNVLFDKWLITVLCFVFLVKEIFQIFQVCKIVGLKYRDVRIVRLILIFNYCWYPALYTSTPTNNLGTV